MEGWIFGHELVSVNAKNLPASACMFCSGCSVADVRRRDQGEFVPGKVISSGLGSNFFNRMMHWFLFLRFYTLFAPNSDPEPMTLFESA